MIEINTSTLKSSRKIVSVTAFVLLSLGMALAAPKLTLASAVSQALSSGPEVTTARANLRKAEANLRAVRADPTSLINTLTQAELDTKAERVSLQNTKLNVAKNVISAYTTTFDAEQRVALAGKQVALNERNLQIAQARLKARVATALDVSKAKAEVNTSRQDLANARAQLPVLKSQLARVIGLTSSDLQLNTLPVAPRLSSQLAALQSGLEERLPSLVKAKHGLEMAELSVKLSKNDWTPARTLQDAEINLANAKLGLADGQRASQTQVRDAYRAYQDALERVALAQQSAKNAQVSLQQAQAKLKAGTAAAISVEQAKVQAQQANLGVQQAQGGVWKALSGLGAASGKDVTGLGVLK